MKKLSTWMVLLLLCTLSTFAQNKIIAVSGQVIEDDTKEPVELAAVQLLSLPDSVQVAGVTTHKKGLFTLPKVKAGKYILKISFVGFHSKTIPLQLSNNAPTKNVGVVTLKTDAVMLGEAVITAEAPQVTVVEDTLVYNSSAYRTPEGAMLEELVKKLPGAEVDEDGNIKINGKEVKKIMVDGKEFFGGDVKTGLKNLPVDMIDKLKTYDKKSDLARITGIDDGEEETVLDLKVKKGMNQGWFGNADVAAGTEKRYSGNLMLNRFVDKTQFSLIGSGNNVNDQGFSGGGGGPRWRRSNGLNAAKTVGVNFATETTKLETGGSARYNYRDADISNINSSERLRVNSYSNSNSKNRNNSIDFNADYRLEWKPDTMTNVIFRPTVSYGKTDNQSRSYSGTFNQDPYSLVANPNNYLDFSKLGEEDPLRDIRVNMANSNSISDGNSLSANASLQLNRRLNNKGRNITFRGSFSYSDRESDRYSKTETRYYQEQDSSPKETEYRNQYITNPTENYNYSAKMTYSEPIAKATFLQFSYNFQYKFSSSDKRTYDLLRFPDWEPGLPLPAEYKDALDKEQGKKAEYNYYNHDITTGLRFLREKYQLSFGVSVQPQTSKLSYENGGNAKDTVRTVINFTPNIDFRYRFSKVSQLRFTYNGRAGQPNMEDLSVNDDSNPLNVRNANPGLKPSFTHSMRMFYNTYNSDRQQGIMTHASFSMTQNAIITSTEYVQSTGGTINTPTNIDGNWNAFAMFGYNTALKNKKFTINSFSRFNYQNNAGFEYNRELSKNEKNTNTALSLNENLNGSYRNDWFEFTLNSSIGYVFERNKLSPEKNQQPYDFSYGASTNVTLPWKMTVSTNMTNNSRRGYSDPSMNRNELIWNAQLAQNFFKGAATVSFEMYDILKQQTSISRSLTASVRSVSEYNGVNSYCMVHFIYRLNIFGNKAAREGMGQRGFDGRGGHGGGRRGGMTPMHRF